MTRNSESAENDNAWKTVCSLVRRYRMRWYDLCIAPICMHLSAAACRSSRVSGRTTTMVQRTLAVLVAVRMLKADIALLLK